MSFSKAQSKAIMHKSGPMMVLAGPGSGKTTVITKRIEYLTRHYQVNPGEILVITFTKAAAKEMKERYLRLIGKESSMVTFGTFHGIYYGILKWAYRFSAANIFSEEEKYRLLREITSKIEMEIDDEKDFLNGIAGEISNIKNNMLDIENYDSLNCPEHVFREIYDTYEARRKALRKIDFDDMLVLCHELFQNRPDILNAWQEKYKYILVDEFQDINQVQYDVIRMLAAPENNLFIVGDDDQSIYKFRGAKPEIMLGFTKDYAQAKKLLLDVNYRSTKAIVNASLRVIGNNEKRYEKEIVTLNEQGVNVHVQEVKDPVEESVYVVGEIRKARETGLSYSDMAVLFRTATEPRRLAETLTEYNIPYRLKEEIPNLFDHFISKDICAYLRLANGGRDRGDFLKIMNRPKRYIARESVESGQVSFESIRRFYCDKEWMLDRIDQMEVDLRILQRMTPYAGIQFIRKHIGYDEFLNEYAVTRRMKKEELYELLDEIQERSRQYKTVDEWFAYIERYTNELRARHAQRDDVKDAVTLLTMHGAKGLEFHTVFLIAANEDITPYKKAALPEDIEEERRMFYVAMTRAKKRLCVSYTKERNKKAMKSSRFVDEILGIKTEE